MQLSVVSSTSFHKYDIQWLDVSTDGGNFVIQDGHAPTMLLIKNGSRVLYRRMDGSMGEIVVMGGVVEITRTSATLLITKS